MNLSIALVQTQMLLVNVTFEELVEAPSSPSLTCSLAQYVPMDISRLTVVKTPAPMNPPRSPAVEDASPTRCPLDEMHSWATGSIRGAD